jgi:hypothetical protein
VNPKIGGGRCYKILQCPGAQKNASLAAICGPISAAVKTTTFGVRGIRRQFRHTSLTIHPWCPIKADVGPTVHPWSTRSAASPDPPLPDVKLVSRRSQRAVHAVSFELPRNRHTDLASSIQPFSAHTNQMSYRRQRVSIAVRRKLPAFLSRHGTATDSPRSPLKASTNTAQGHGAKQRSRPRGIAQAPGSPVSRGYLAAVAIAAPQAPTNTSFARLTAHKRAAGQTSVPRHPCQRRGPPSPTPALAAAGELQSSASAISRHA